MTNAPESCNGRGLEDVLDRDGEYVTVRCAGCDLVNGCPEYCRCAPAIPAPEGEEPAEAAVELAAKAVYRLFIGADLHPWVEGGNSLMQCDARRYARAALAAQPQPATFGLNMTIMPAVEQDERNRMAAELLERAGQPQPSPAEAHGDERAAFEAWAESFDLPLDEALSGIPGNGPLYVNAETVMAWEGWNARAAANVQPKGTAAERIISAALKRAMEHPVVLEITADCVSCADTENDARSDPEFAVHDSAPYRLVAGDLRCQAAAIRAQDPEIWPVLQYDEAQPVPSPAPAPAAVPLADGFDGWWAAHRIKRVLNPAGVARMVWEASARHNRKGGLGATDSTPGFYPEDEGSTPSGQATFQSPAVAPLTEEQIVNDGLMMCPTKLLDNCADAFEAGVKFAERAHGIGKAYPPVHRTDAP